MNAGSNPGDISKPVTQRCISMSHSSLLGNKTNFTINVFILATGLEQLSTSI